MAKYVKYIRNNIAYYITTEVVPNVCVNGNFDDVTDRYLLQFSDFTCNLSTNELIKCRRPIDETIEMGMDVTWVKQHAETIVQSVEYLRDELIARSATGHLTVGERAILVKLNSCLYKEYPHKEHK